VVDEVVDDGPAANLDQLLGARDATQPGAVAGGRNQAYDR
jgi:hypothetical protein